MTTVVSYSIHRYQILNDIEIDYGAVGPDRTNKIMTLRCIPLEQEIKDDGQGATFDYTAPVRIEVYCRDIKASGKRQEPQQLIRMEKKLMDFLNINKFALMDDGISHITVRNTRIREVDKSEYELSNWYLLEITVDLQYRLKAVAI